MAQWGTCRKNRWRPQNAAVLILDLTEIDRDDSELVGGKAANLGELSRIEGITVPAGFCVTTDAFRRGMTPDLAAAVTAAVAQLGGGALAVRSSATSEDSPTASFAGQYDTFLDVAGPEAVLEHVQRCWACIDSDQATAYRRQHGIGHVAMGVVVQRMVPADVSGVLFTADPATGHRTVTAVEAVRGRGDALVSGLVTPEVDCVRRGEIAERSGLLTDAQMLALDRVGRRIEAHFGAPQDIEWCLADGVVHIVQSRPITTLFPVPQAPDQEFRVYLSMGHQQMMTDAMTALGRSVWQMTTPAPMVEAGARLFADATARLSTPGFLDMIGRSDPLMRDALQTVLGRDPRPAPPEPVTAPDDVAPSVVAALIARNRESVATLRRDIQDLEGPALFAFIRDDLQELRRLLFAPDSHSVIMAAHHATWWLNERLERWLGDTHAADVLSRSAPGNVTAEMGLALLDVADAIRPNPDLVAHLRDTGDPSGIDAVREFLDVHGVRCPGEIDIGRPRWRDDPAALVPVVLADVEHAVPGEARRRVERGRREAQDKEADVLQRLRHLPDGEAKATETARVIAVLRATIGYREYPKFGMVSRYALYRDALVAEAARLGAAEDVVHLRFDELEEAARTRHVDIALIDRRRRELAAAQALTPPRVLTSEGEAVTGSYRRRGMPTGALAGLAVSAGDVEGRARVVHEPTALEPGDVLVTTFTDPAWSPTFLTVAGLVTEVGGLMTHGAVIAREYGLPAVVGVPGATRLIPDGARIRVDAVHGWVEILS